MGRRVVFLDVDGVLCLSATASGAVLDADATAALWRVVRETGAEIVLSSTWREMEPLLEMLTEHLGEAGMAIADHTPFVELGEIYYVVPDAPRLPIDDLSAVQRAVEIGRWLRANAGDVAAWVVLDDLALPFAARFVQTSYAEGGLTDAHAARAIAALQTPLIPGELAAVLGKLEPPSNARGW